MEFKGTKGKWEGIENTGVFTDNDESVFETGCGCCTSGDLNKYDALLISKAPEMLEMLIDIVNANNKGNLEHLNFYQIEQLIKQATEL